MVTADIPKVGLPSPSHIANITQSKQAISGEVVCSVLQTPVGVTVKIPDLSAPPQQPPPPQPPPPSLVTDSQDRKDVKTPPSAQPSPNLPKLRRFSMGAEVSGCIESPADWQIFATVSAHLEGRLKDDASKMVEDAKTQSSKMRLMELNEFKESRYTGRPAATVLPKTSEIRFWITQFCERAQLESLSTIVMLVYLERLRANGNVALTADSWKPLCAVSLMLAQKLYDDIPLINSQFTIMYPTITPAEFNLLERRLLTLLDFQTLVSQGTYAEYYFGLRSYIPAEYLDFECKSDTLPSDAKLRQLTRLRHLSALWDSFSSIYKQSKRAITIEDIRSLPPPPPIQM